MKPNYRPSFSSRLGHNYNPTRSRDGQITGTYHTYSFVLQSLIVAYAIATGCFRQYSAPLLHETVDFLGTSPSLAKMDLNTRV